MKSLSFFAKYTTQGATSRYRSFAFAFRLLSYNYNFEIQSFLPIDYLDDLFSKRPKKKWKIILSYLDRFFSILRSSNNLIIERELFPFLPYGFEKWFLKRTQYILDFDDNVWEDYQDKSWLKNKYDKLVLNASGVIVGNDYLCDYVQNLNSNVVKIPTVIDLEHYQLVEEEKFERFTIVWIGSSITYKYIEAFSELFVSLSKKIDYDLLIVASKELENRKIEGVSMRFVDWSSETEISFLKKSHIGIMPLTDDNFSQGKSAFKLIQYLAAGIPLIGSAVGENNHVIKEGENGYLVSTKEEWMSAIAGLYNDKDLIERIAINCEKDAYDYSIQKYFPLYRDFIDRTFDTAKTLI